MLERVRCEIISKTENEKVSGSNHRDKGRVQMTAKMFPHLKSLCQLFMGPTLGFDTKQRNSFLIRFGVIYNKSKIQTILFIVKYEKNHTF